MLSEIHYCKENTEKIETVKRQIHIKRKNLLNNTEMTFSERSSIYREELIIKDQLSYKDKFNNLLLFIWNPDRKEIFGRDGLSWAKLGLFYACFYMAIAGLFCTMLAIFMAIIDKREPTYYNQFSVMWAQKVNLESVGVNPGLGFRPQKDSLTTLIRVKSSEKNELHPNAYIHYVRLIDDFLSSYLIVDKRGEQIINCDANSDPAYLEHQFTLNKGI